MITITLTNIRCWEGTHVFKFDTNFILLSAMSGKGKTSILDGIVFALYDKGYKICTHGLKQCSVVFECTIGNHKIKIKRTKGPNSVLVNDKYEDIDAENMIKDKFGSYKEFMLSSYIQQKSKNSFLSMNPAEKLDFLENVAFAECDINSLKKKIRCKIKDISLTLSKYQGESDTLKKIVDSTTRITPVAFPFKTNDKKGARKCEMSKLAVYSSNVEKLTVKISKLTRQEASTMVLRDACDTCISQILEIDGKLDAKNICYNDLIDTFIGEDELETLKLKYKHTQRHQKYMELKNTYEDLKGEWMKNLYATKQELQQTIELHRETLESLEKTDHLYKTKSHTLDNLNSIHVLYKNLKKTIGKIDAIVPVDSIIQSIVDTTDGIDRTVDKIGKIKSDIDLSKCKKVCPECSTDLVHRDGVLIKWNPDSSSNIEELTTLLEGSMGTLEKLYIQKDALVETKNKMDRMDTLLVDLCRYEIKIDAVNREDSISDIDIELCILEDIMENIKKYNTTKDITHKLLGKVVSRLKNIDNNIFDSEVVLKNHYEKLTITKTRYKACKSKLDPTITLDSSDGNINDTIETETEKLYKIHNIQDSIDTLEEQKTVLVGGMLEKKEEYKSRYKKDLSVIDVIILREECTKKCDDMIAKGKKLKKNIDKIDEYERYMEEKIKNDKWCVQQKDLKVKVKATEQTLKIHEILNAKILEAESVAVSSIVGSINAHAKGYLDSFFEDDPISVEIKPFKDVKKDKKPQINIVVGYKSMECDIKSLSGGEYDRVQMAFTMAISDMMNSPILLMDESISSLDEKTSEYILHQIHMACSTKVIINVAHQICSGSFDEIITL
jgi:hypothetical protein